MKKLFTILLLVCFKLTSSAQEGTTLKGDVNGDGKVNIVDITMLIDLILRPASVEHTYMACPNSHHPHKIDLGLSSGTLWACCNVGASTPEDYGGYFAWGEVVTKEVYNWDMYHYGYYDKFGDYSHLVNIGSDIADTQYDAATTIWGTPWHMPTLEQCRELINNTTSEWITQNGVYGRKFTGKNGASIFLPAAGSRRSSDLVSVELDGHYWSSTLNESTQHLASGLSFYSEDLYEQRIGRYYGRSVRPVCNNSPSPVAYTGELKSKSADRAVVIGTFQNMPTDAICGIAYSWNEGKAEETTDKLQDGQQSFTLSGLVPNTTYKYRAFVKVGDYYVYAEDEYEFTTDDNGYITCPDSHHPHMIDLGLHSGTLWACCNVGASTPEDNGGYFAWGEVATKGVYSWKTYQYGSSRFDVVDIGSDIADTQYDAATANWGAPWCMPTIEQYRELINYTTSERTTQNGVYGRKFTGKNGGSIFLPAAGYRSESGHYDAGSSGDYWSSTLLENHLNVARFLNFNSAGEYTDFGSNRFNGHSVRPVRKN